MLEKIRQKWVEWLFAIIVIILTTLATNYATTRRDTNASIKNKIDQKADKVEVDAKNAELRVEIKEGDDHVKKLLEQHAQETNERTLSMDRKLDILLSRTK